MNTLIVWILIMGSVNSGGTLLPVAHFATEADCKVVAISIYKGSNDLPRVPYGNAFCVEAKIVKP